MAEHRIRLRLAWERIGPGVEPAGRVDLPTDWSPEDASRPIRLRRGFGLPRAGPGGTIVLELADVPGLVATRLNGRPVELGPGVDGVFRVEVGGHLGRRSVLELDVDPAAAGGRPWGSIALVVVEGAG